MLMNGKPQAIDARPHLVIVGGGFGGLNAAQHLRHAEVRITIVDRRNHHLFQPLLYQVATAALSPANIAYPIRSIVRRNLNTRVVLEEATAIDLAARCVATTGGDLKYDFLILAAGAGNFYFGHDEWAEFAPGLKSLDDATEIRRRILLSFERAEREDDTAARAMLLTFVVVGGGPTGVELAGAIAEISRQVIVGDFRRIDPRDARVVLVEAGPRILPSFEDGLAAKAAEALRRRGVEIMAGTAAQDIAPDLIRFATSEIRAHTIIWAAGVKASPLAQTLGVELDRGGRVKVRTDLTISGHPEVFVIGDLAACVDVEGRAMPGLAPVAIQQGRCAAANIERALAHQPYNEFRYLDKGALAAVGRAFAIMQRGRLRLSGLVAWMIWCVVHIAYLIGFGNRIIVMFEWAWAYVAYQRGARLITGNPAEHVSASEKADAESRSEVQVGRS